MLKEACNDNVLFSLAHKKPKSRAEEEEEQEVDEKVGRGRGKGRVVNQQAVDDQKREMLEKLLEDQKRKQRDRDKKLQNQ